MNKKFFLGMFAAAGMLLATSCSNDDLIEQGSGDTAVVSFNLTTEGAPMSRAISDGESANELWYAVFDAEGNRISTIEQVTKEVAAFPTKENLLLAKGQTYKVAFWAQNKDCGAYTVDNNMNVKVSYENAANNDETRDAFFKTVEFTVNGDASIDVELKRPFAQINVGVTQDDWEKAVESDVEIAQSSVKIKNAATSINLLDGSVTGETEVSYGFATVPAQFETPEDLSVTVNGNETKYKWLSMCYILVPDNSETATDGVYGANKANLDKLAFEFKTADGSKSIKFEEGLNGVPVQRNYRTNIVGRILTGSIDVNISLDKKFVDDHNYPDGSAAQQLEFAAKVGGAVTLSEDVTLDKPIEVYKDMTIDLNGKTLSVKDGVENKQRVYSALISVKDNATVTINGNGTIKTSNSLLYAVETRGGKLVINGGEYIGNCTAAYALTGEITINGGKFSQEGYENNNYVLNLLDANGKNQTASITVTGGSFKNFDPANNEAENPKVNFCTEGYKSFEKDNWYYVVPEELQADLLISTSEELGTFQKDVNENGNSYAGKTVVLLNDIDLTDIAWNPIGQTGSSTKAQFNGTFDGNGKTIKNLNVNSDNSSTTNGYALFGWLQGTVKNLTIDGAKIDASHNVGVVAGYVEFGHVENCTVKNSKIVANHVNDDLCGDKVGGIAGYLANQNGSSIKNCKVENTTITAGRDAGQVVGCACSEAGVINCFATNVTLTAGVGCTGANMSGIIGRNLNP